MSRPLRIDFVAPPFAGHLFPLLQLARSVANDSNVFTRVLSTNTALKSIEVSGQDSVELLPGQDSAVAEIANTTSKIGSNPLRLIGQLKQNLSLMSRLRDELRDLWSSDRPDLVVADFVVPVAGLTAQELGIEWWTGMPTPCVLETGDGVPSYLGGWSPVPGVYGKLRDATGRAVIRSFKATVRTCFSRSFRQVGVPTIYRDDGLERIYSPKRILGFGLHEFEFPRSWPDHFEFIGPLTKSPPFPAPQLEFEPGRRHVLVTLGTHLPWARQTALELIQTVAARMTDCVFHFTRGEPGAVTSKRTSNIVNLGYVPYSDFLASYDAAIVHGGTGITYACLEHAVPMLVWPHDYDQFDHAARITYHGLGIRIDPTPSAVERDLRRLLDDSSFAPRLDRFRTLALASHPEDRFRELIAGLGNGVHLGSPPPS